MGMIDLSSLFQTTSYPVSPIAQFLQIAYQARQAKRQRQEAEAERKRQEERYQLQLGQARRTEAQAEERTRLRTMRLGDVLPNIRAEFKDWTVGRLEDMGIPLAQVIDDPRAEAERRRAEAVRKLEDARRAAATYGRPVTVPGAEAAPAFGGYAPQKQSPFADVPGSFEQQIPRMVPGAPAQVFTGGPEDVTYGPPSAGPVIEVPGLGRMPVSEAVKIVGTEGLRRITGVDPTPEKPKTIPVTIGKKTFNVTEAQAAQLAAQETARTAQQGQRPTMVTVKDPRTGQMVTIPATALPEFYRPYPVRGGVTGIEGLAPAQKRIVDQYNRIGALAEKAQDKLDDPMMMAETPQAKSLQGRIAVYKRQQAAILRRYPWIGRYVGEELAPGGGAGGGLGGELPAQAIEFIQQAVEQRVPLAQVLAWARQAGLNPQQVEAQYKRLTIPQQRTSAVPAVPVRPQQRTVSLAQVQTEARRRGVHPNLVIQEYNRRGIMVQ